MPRKGKPMPSLLDRMLGEASWLLSHAQALAGYGREQEAAAEHARAAACEEQVASLLEAAGEEREAAIHRVSAGSCLERLGQYARAATLLRAALACADLPDEYRTRVEKQRTRCLAQVEKELTRTFGQASRKQSSVAP